MPIYPVDTTMTKSSIQPAEAEKAEAGAPEIEIAYEMIEASVASYCDARLAFGWSDPTSADLRQMCRDIYLAMVLARPSV
jgi:hypothetical protein